MKRLQPGDCNPHPFKSGRSSPLRGLHFVGQDVRFARIDPAHTFAIDGIGKSYFASSLVLLVQMEWFGSGSTDDKFKNAYSRFMAFCDARGKSTSIHEFSHKTLKLTPGSRSVCISSSLSFQAYKGRAPAASQVARISKGAWKRTRLRSCGGLAERGASANGLVFTRRSSHGTP